MQTMEPPFTNMPTVPSIDRPSLRDYGRLRDEWRPYTFKGCLDDWALYDELRELPSAKQKIEYLQRRAADEVVSFVTLPSDSDGHLYFADGLTTNGKRLDQAGSFREFSEVLAACLTSARVLYMHSVPVATLPRLADKLTILPYVEELLVAGTNFWIGSGGHVVDLHYDLDCNFICVLEGSKRVILAPPLVMHDVYPRALDRGPYGATASSAKLLKPDLEKFPRLRAAAAHFQVVVLGPGDVLYVPPYWWHHVESFGFNVMVNTWQLAVAPNVFGPVAALRRTALQEFAHQPAHVRSSYRKLYARDVFQAFDEHVGVHPTVVTGGRSRSLDRLVDETRTAMKALPDFIRGAEGVFYDQWIFRTLGDPIENQPGEFERMIERMRSEAPES